ncbi:hypothetical protein [Enterococcus sp. LJL51]|uniref:hypothetical protein n=1 Tax=Enterococcus sp. LJL51 TaxID=3416656 RepID=UPI003CEB224E
MKGVKSMNYDIEELSKIYDFFIGGIKFFSSDFNKQSQHLKNAVLSDELASDFLYTDFVRAEILYEHEWITKKQMELMSKIKLMLEQMGLDKDLWDDDAVKNSEEWEKCRKMGKELLKSLDNGE